MYCCSAANAAAEEDDEEDELEFEDWAAAAAAAAAAEKGSPSLVPAAAAAGGNTGRLLFSTRPASNCTIAGQGTSFSTPRALTLPPGSYRINCRNEELASSGTFSVTITAGASRPLNR